MSSTIPRTKTPPEQVRTFGAYTVKAVLGEGGMGVVYLAEHQRLGRRVALKRLKDHLAQNRRAVRRFVNEAWAIGKIRHRNIVKVTDFVLGEHDVYYIMELLEGRTLADVLEQSGALEPDRAVHITLEVAGALAAVHEQGFVHADIKPSNIFLVDTAEGDEAVKLLDFGVASLIDGEAQPDDDGAASLVTPVYMSPEQANRQPVTAATDLYSLGAVLHHMLAGAPPFEAATFAEYVYKHTQEPPPPLRRRYTGRRRLPPPLEDVVRRCLEKNPADRFPNARSLRQALLDRSQSRDLKSVLARWLLHTDRTGLTTRVCVTAGLVALGVALLTWPSRAHLEGAAPTLSAPPPARVVDPDTRAAAPRRTRVELRIESTPPRALVRRVGPQPRVLGLTPLTLTHPPGPGSWQLEVRRTGYTPQRARVKLNADVQVRLTLHPEAASTPPGPRPTIAGVRPRRAGPRQARPVDPRGIIDPWGDARRR